MTDYGRIMREIDAEGKHRMWSTGPNTTTKAVSNALRQSRQQQVMVLKPTSRKHPQIPVAIQIQKQGFKTSKKPSGT